MGLYQVILLQSSPDPNLASEKWLLSLSQASPQLTLHFYDSSSSSLFGNLLRLPIFFPESGRVMTSTEAWTCYLLPTVGPEFLLSLCSAWFRAPVTHQDGVACQSCTVLTAPRSAQPHLPGGSLSVFLSWRRVSFQETHIPIIFRSIAYHQRPLCNLPVSVQTLEYWTQGMKSKKAPVQPHLQPE